jgi:hypothetical protein
VTGLTEVEAQFLRDPNYAVVAALRDDGSPHQTVIWIDWVRPRRVEPYGLG